MFLGGSLVHLQFVNHSVDIRMAFCQLALLFFQHLQLQFSGVDICRYLPDGRVYSVGDVVGVCLLLAACVHEYSRGGNLLTYSARLFLLGVVLAELFLTDRLVLRDLILLGLHGRVDLVDHSGGSLLLLLDALELSVHLVGAVLHLFKRILRDADGALLQHYGALDLAELLAEAFYIFLVSAYFFLQAFESGAVLLLLFTAFGYALFELSHLGPSVEDVGGLVLEPAACNRAAGVDYLTFESYRQDIPVELGYSHSALQIPYDYDSAEQVADYVIVFSIVCQAFRRKGNKACLVLQFLIRLLSAPYGCYRQEGHSTGLVLLKGSDGFARAGVILADDVLQGLSQCGFDRSLIS